MFAQTFALSAFIASCHAGVVGVYPESYVENHNNYEVPIYGPGYGNGYGYAPSSGDYYSHPKYNFAYGVHDPHTGDHKSQEEYRDGDLVKGYYTVADPDGTLRVVHYTADDHNGFNAVVEKIGHPVHPQPVIVKKVVPIVEKVIYEKPVGYGYGIGHNDYYDY